MLGLSDTLGSYPLIKMGKNVGVEAKALPPAEYTSFEGQDRLPYSTCVNTCVHRGVRDAIGCALPHVFQFGKKRRETTLRYPDEGTSPGIDDVPPCSLAKYLEYLEALALWRSTEKQLIRDLETGSNTEDVGTSFIWIPERDPATMTEEEIFEEEKKRILREKLEASPMSERCHLDACKMDCQAKRRIFITLFYRADNVDPAFELFLPSSGTLTRLEDTDNAPLARLISDVGGVAGITFGASVLSVSGVLLMRFCASSICRRREIQGSLGEEEE
ncbi:uncharacterized protein LOC143022654 [Oratosquilla oratoria]|uniref:uncharacterized protein LOC143022654 n=1 Tax=Oratosquilla oratoria TaxID=337810 RepID=UPI003F7678A6